ncbi:hypothetical protein BJ165DRAFT_180349 [Panaeolus papilionaceus]|nr:hypothetical protein BJ165DRAFT_180349 [Panaeolus papilionaceus]
MSLECDAIPNPDVRALCTQPSQSADAAWYLVPDLHSLIVHEVTNIRIMEDLALARPELTVKLFFRDPEQRDRLAVCFDAQMPSSLDLMLSAILDEIEVVLTKYPDEDPVPSLDGEIVNKRRIKSLLDDLARVSWPSPQHMRLALIQGLHRLTLLDLSVVAGLEAYNIVERARNILNKYITIYQPASPSCHPKMGDHRETWFAVRTTRSSRRMGARLP